MKKNITKILALIALSLFAIACSENNFESTFNSPPSERLQTSINEYSDLLESSEKGWVLEYYPEKNQIYGGYNYVIKFEEGKISKISYELSTNASEVESSTYDIIASGGPVLTFNTYNKFMHEFANPSFSSYQAKQGDYEFYLKSKSDNTITLQGTKSGNTIRMIKLNETPEEYLTKVLGIKNYLASASYAVTLDGNDLPLPDTGAKLIFPQGTGKEPIEISYNYTSKGIKLYEPITLGGSKALEFILNKDTNQLISIDGNVIIYVLFSPININQDWQIVTSIPGAISPAFLTKFNQVKDANTTVYSETLRDFLIFGNTTVSGETKPGILFISDPGPYVAQHLLGFGGVPGEAEQLSIIKGEGAYNWQYYTHLQPLVDFIADNSPYTLSTTDPAATQIQLTSATDPTVWFYILK